MILLKDVSYEWEDGRTALKNINLEIKKGEFVLISGKSGSGKSTLGSVMNGLIPHYYKGKMKSESLMQLELSYTWRPALLWQQQLLEDLLLQELALW